MAAMLALDEFHAAAPNPSVVCRIYAQHCDQPIVGHTQPRGGAHAEIAALARAAQLGIDVRGALVHVSLEPCAHFGHTPPCTQALIAAGIGKVVIATLDPNPLVAGQGVQQLRSAGIEVEVLPSDHPQALASRELNIGFFSRMIRRRPWVRMKIASSFDGITALANGASQWITHAAARADGQAWRARACAVLSGIGTIAADDPLLNVRLPIETTQGAVAAPRQPHFVIVDSKLDIAPTAKILSTQGQRGLPSAAFDADTINSIAPRSGLIYHASTSKEKIEALTALGAKLIYLPNAQGNKVDLAAMIHDLAVQHEINELHIEAGFKLNGSLIQAALVDELLLYLAPKFLGSGMGLAQLGALTDLKQLPQAQELILRSAQLIGASGEQNLRVMARFMASAQFLR